MLQLLEKMEEEEKKADKHLLELIRIFSQFLSMAWVGCGA